MKWTVLELTIKRDGLELATALLYDLGQDMFEVVDEFVTQEELGHMFADLIDEELDMTSETIIIKCFLSENDPIESIKASILEAFESYQLEMTMATSFSDEEDWANKWKDYFKPFKIGSQLVIKPIWENYEEQEGDIIIEIEPGMAFGSGTHETTSLCTKAIERYIKPLDKVLDVGCGSGILSLVAAKLGANEVVGVDIDINAVHVARENVLSNHLEEKIHIAHGDLLEQVNDRYEIVVANILAEVILVLAPQIKEVIKKDGLFIASGIIKEKEQLVMEKLESEGFTVLEIMNDGDWVAIVSKAI